MAINRLLAIDIPVKFDATGYPAPAIDDRALQASIRAILLTIPGERPYRPTFGSWLTLILFEQMNTITALRARDEVIRAIGQWEPRVTVLGVNFEIIEDEARINLTVSWEANGRQGTSLVAVPIGG